jgi:predicted acylesterase/phospholipase RssA
MEPRSIPGGYDAVVFAGGGCRCFWQAGFWTAAQPALGLEPRRVAGVSAGSAFACAIFAGVLDQVLDEFVERVAANPRNAYPGNALGDAPIFPHEGIYRGTILATLDQAAIERLHAGPEIRIAVGRRPAWSGPRLAFALGLVAFLAEQPGRGRVHAVWGRRFGFRHEMASVRQCRTPEELADLVLHSSCTPPITPFYDRDGDVVFDGGIVDAAPVEAAGPAERTLVLLTRAFPEEALPQRPGLTYAKPSEPVPVAKWDYTSPDLVRRTFELGLRDGERFAEEATRGCAA